jgi:pimeloyl-ACP methyl ester carboxylesterase
MSPSFLRASAAFSFALALLAFQSCAQSGSAGSRGPTLAEARKGFVTHTNDTAAPVGPADPPPPGVFSLVHFPSTVGPLAAYVTPRPKEGGRRPAIVWVVGGLDNSIGSTAWRPAPIDNDQSARAFRDAGIVLMLPSLRGGNDNPGKRESFFGEVDDVIAAREYVSHLDYVDPDRVYLGGHSTGGTLALLVAETTPRFRTIFSFGPMPNVAGIGSGLVFDARDKNELRLRSPMFFASAIRTPTFAFEGSDPPTNKEGFPWLLKGAGGAPLQTFVVPGVDHFSILVPVTALLARKIVSDVGPSPSITVTARELANAVGAP